MAGQSGREDKKKKASKRSKKTKRKDATATIQQTVNTVNGPRDKDRTVQRFDQLEKVPSNAPTMAIAPSDYEHIFHEGPSPTQTTDNERTMTDNNNTTTTNKGSPGLQTMNLPQATPPTPPQVPVLLTPPPPPLRNLHSPSPPPPPLQIPRPRTPDLDQGGYQQTYGRMPYQAEVMVTPDGYTLLGQVPDPMSRRIALPPHVVRASNQFSRAALARISRYLASRAELPR